MIGGALILSRLQLQLRASVPQPPKSPPESGWDVTIAILVS